MIYQKYLGLKPVNVTAGDIEKKKAVISIGRGRFKMISFKYLKADGGVKEIINRIKEIDKIRDQLMKEHLYRFHNRNLKNI